MPGMSSGLQTNNPTIISAFKSLLLHEGLVILVILALLAVAWNVLRGVQLRRAAAGQLSVEPWPYPEPTARRVLRIAFGIIWIFDGLLQAQPSMPLGMTTQVIEPTAATSPAWVQHLVNAGATIWSNHPITAPASAVWIQVGIGVWLLVAPRGNWSRLAGLASIFWGLVVWIFGESFGGIFAPGLTWAFGAPGAVLLYCFAGLLIALPDRAWATPRLGRVVLSVMGLFFVGMAVLQAWPGRGFWQGQLHQSSSPGTLTGMVQQMSQTPQPRLSRLMGGELRGLRRCTRLGSEPLPRDFSCTDRDRLLDGPGGGYSRRHCRRNRCLPRRLGAHRRLRVLWGRWY